MDNVLYFTKRDFRRDLVDGSFRIIYGIDFYGTNQENFTLDFENDFSRENFLKYIDSEIGL